MGEPNESSRIWKPLVEPTKVAVPTPGSESGLKNELLQQFYTKTSLVSLVSERPASSSSSRERSLNREILSASQSFNNTPKPFARSQTLAPQSSPTNKPISSIRRESSTTTTNKVSTVEQTKTQLINLNLNSTSNQSKLPLKTPLPPPPPPPPPPPQALFSSPLSFAPSSSSSFSSSSSSSLSPSVNNKAPKVLAAANKQANSPEPKRVELQAATEAQEEENMAPKLVHKQYNSPIDLYSMNNIRKTIEAHTEFIAPGLKGINFMKPDAPVNKQSEVYKLVMEEEEQRARQLQGLLGTADESQQATASMAAAAPSHQHLAAGARDVVNSSEHYHRQIVQQQLIESQRAFERSGAPVCLACGQSIRGPFAKICNQAIHAQCFNCSTCGASLKNVGYFTVNEKLYCDIHAKQVANMMRLDYDFNNAENRQLQDGGCHVESAPSDIVRQQQHQKQQAPASSGSSVAPTLANRQPNTTRSATISTMFSNGISIDPLGAQQHQHQQHQQQSANKQAHNSWSWRPTMSEDQHNNSNNSNIKGLLCSSTMQQATTSSSCQHQHRQLHQTLVGPDGAVRPPAGPKTSMSSMASHQLQQSSFLQTASSSRNQGLLKETGTLIDGGSGCGNRVPVCAHCKVQIRGPYILAGKTTWCKQCSQTQFKCSSCQRCLLNLGFIEDNLQQRYYCEHCFEAYYAPICSKCNLRIKGDCLNALSKQWHPSCFVCGHCQRPFGNSSFYLEDNVPYCERDWNLLFTTKCFACSYPIEAGDKWIEALERSYHTNCFRCSSCQTSLEGSTFYCKAGKPYCRLHAR